MSKPEIPASVRRAGIADVKHDLPDGYEIDWHADFVRIFKEDIQRLDRKRQKAAYNDPDADKVDQKPTESR